MNQPGAAPMRAVRRPIRTGSAAQPWRSLVVRLDGQTRRESVPPLAPYYRLLYVADQITTKGEP